MLTRDERKSAAAIAAKQSLDRYVFGARADAVGRTDAEVRAAIKGLRLLLSERRQRRAILNEMRGKKS